MSYRQLQQNEIETLSIQSCFSNNWEKVQVAQEFNPDHVRHVRFEGDVKLGVADGRSVEAGGAVRSSGLYFSHLSNCEIGDHSYVSGVGRLNNYVVETNVILENITSVTTEGESSFGTGTRMEVLNEGGGREIPLFDKLSAQIAYLMVNYRHEPEMIEALEALVEDYGNNLKSTRGKIETGCLIQNSRAIRNVRFGPNTKVSGIELLEDGTVVSNTDDPVKIGEGVIARKFMILSGSQIDSGAILDKCFVGQAVRIGKQFSAEGSLFFSNCEAFHGEAVSLFAGPFTATHHKSTLLIAAFVSFFNAGSGTNQSNHMYKLGPLHQGVLERGV